MARVITFSRTFPSYHPKAGQPTFFVEKVVKSLHLMGNRPSDIPDSIFSTEMYHICEPKHQTIRGGRRWKVGDKFSPRVWGDDINPTSGRSGAYHNKQIIIAPDIEVKKVFDIKINLISRPFYTVNGKGLDNYLVTLLHNNDGLGYEDFKSWFCKPPLHSSGYFVGQIICWNESVNY